MNACARQSGAQAVQPTESELGAIRKACIGITRQLKKSHVDFPDLLKLLNLLKRFPSNKEVVGLGVSILVSVEDKDEAYTQRLCAHGLLDFVLHAMRAIPEDASIQDGCCGLLSSMLMQGFPAYEREQLQARTGVMTLLLAVLAKSGSSDGAVHKALTALSNMLPQSPKLKQEFVAAGGVATAKAATEARQRSEPVVIGFVWVIKNLTAGFEPSTREVLRAGCIPLVLSLMKRFSALEMFHSSCLPLFTNISYHEVLRPDMYAYEELLACVLTSMDKFSRNDELLAYGCMSVRDVASTKGCVPERITACRAVQRVCRFMSMFPRSGDVQLRGSEALAACTELSERCVADALSSDAVALLVQAGSFAPSEHVVVLPVCRALAAIVRVSAGKAAAVSLLPRVNRLLTSVRGFWSGNRTISSLVAEVTAALSSSK